jgi:hypothetical protein
MFVIGGCGCEVRRHARLDIRSNYAASASASANVSAGAGARRKEWSDSMLDPRLRFTQL